MSFFWKSEEGVQEYSKLNKPFGSYPNRPTDIAYDNFLQKIGGKPTKVEVRKIVRIKDADDKEYLTYGDYQEGKDGLGNTHAFSRPGNLGTFPIPEEIRKAYIDENDQQQTKTSGIRKIDTGYNIPFSKENLEKLYKQAAGPEATERNKGARRTQLLVKRYNQRPVTVLKYEDFRDGEFEDLYEHGRVTPPEERQQEKKTAQQQKEEEAEKKERQRAKLKQQEDRAESFLSEEDEKKPMSEQSQQQAEESQAEREDQGEATTEEEQEANEEDRPEQDSNVTRRSATRRSKTNKQLHK